MRWRDRSRVLTTAKWQYGNMPRGSGASGAGDCVVLDSQSVELGEIRVAKRDWCAWHGASGGFAGESINGSGSERGSASDGDVSYTEARCV